jgi:hypothetical protein
MLGMTPATNPAAGFLAGIGVAWVLKIQKLRI